MTEKITRKVSKLPKSVVEIEGEIATDIFESFYGRALKHLGEHVELDGFRKGKVPENILVKNVPEIKILEEMAEMALSEYYPKILEEEKIDAISRPEISITKLARNNPLGFKIKTATLPEIKLPDYKALAKSELGKITDKDKDFTVTEEEIENTILDIRKSRAPKKPMSEVAKEHIHKEGEEHDHDHKSEKVDLPEWNDEFVQALGPFENIEDFKNKLRENLALEKSNQLKEKTRIKIMEEIIKNSELDVPDILVDSEVSRILYTMESDITAMGMKFEDYLKHLNKSAEDLRKEFRADGEKKAKLSLILHKISEVENIKADADRVEEEVQMILAHYKDADPDRARAHAENVLTNEKIFQFLEEQSS
jgi:trigger factor